MASNTTSQERVLGPEGVLALLLVAALPAVFAPAFTHQLVLRQSVLGIVGIGVALLWVAQVTRGTAVRIRAVGVQAPLWVLVAVGAVSAVWASNAWDVIVPAGVWIAVAALALAVLAPTGRKISLRALTLAASSGLLVGGGATIAMLLGARLFEPGPSYPSTAAWLILDTTGYATIALPFCLAAVLRYAGVTRWVSLAGLVLASVLVGLSHVTEAWWALGVGGVGAQAILLLTRRDSAMVRRAILATLSVGAVVVLAALLPRVEGASTYPGEAVDSVDPEIARLTAPEPGIMHQLPQIPRGDGVREFLTLTGLAALADHPIAGSGLGQGRTITTRYRATESAYFKALYTPLPVFASLHSTPLSLAAELGLVGLCAFLALLVLTFAHLIRASLACPADDAELEHTLWGTVTTFCVAVVLCVMVPLSFLPATAAMWGLALGGAVAIAHQVLPIGLGLGTWSLGGRSMSAPSFWPRFIGVGLVTLLAATSLGYLEVRVLLGDYERQWGNLLFLLRGPGQLDQAMEHFGAAAQHNEGDDNAFAMRAQCHVARVELDPASVDLGRAIALVPNDELYLQERGKIARLAREFKDARTYYRAALDEHPRYLDAQIGLAKTLAALSDSDGALNTLRRALDDQPPAEQAMAIHAELAKFYVRQDRLVDAARQVELAQAASRQSGLSVNVRSVVLEIERKRKKQAAEAAKGDNHDDYDDYDDHDAEANIPRPTVPPRAPSPLAPPALPTPASPAPAPPAVPAPVTP